MVELWYVEQCHLTGMVPFVFCVAQTRSLAPHLKNQFRSNCVAQAQTKPIPALDLRERGSRTIILTRSCSLEELNQYRNTALEGKSATLTLG